MLLRVVPALATLFLILLLVADTGAGISKCSSHFQGTCLGLFMCSGLGPAVEACAVATVQPHNPYCVGPVMCTLP